MPYLVEELFDSREREVGATQSTAWNLLVTADTVPEAEDDEGVKAAVLAFAPTEFLSMPRRTSNYRRLGLKVWQASVQYGNFAAEESFDTTGGTQRVIRSFQTMSRGAPPGATAPDFHGLIGVTRDSVEGVDLTVPAYVSKVVGYLPDAFVTNAYKQLLRRLTGTVNDAPFREYGTGECLFLGAAGVRSGVDFWQLSFAFAGSSTETSIQIASPLGNMTVPTKEGWDYLWVRYIDREDTAARAIVKVPAAWYVERVYRRASLATLGI